MGTTTTTTTGGVNPDFSHLTTNNKRQRIGQAIINHIQGQLTNQEDMDKETVTRLFYMQNKDLLNIINEDTTFSIDINPEPPIVYSMRQLMLGMLCIGIGTMLITLALMRAL